MNDELRFRYSCHQQHYETTFRKKTRLHRRIYDHIKQRISAYKHLQHYNF